MVSLDKLLNKSWTSGLKLILILGRGALSKNPKTDEPASEINEDAPPNILEPKSLTEEAKLDTAWPAWVSERPTENGDSKSKAGNEIFFIDKFSLYFF